MVTRSVAASDDVSLTLSIGVKVYGFLTVPADAKCGVCAHEIGHLGSYPHCSLDVCLLTNLSLRLARFVRYRLFFSGYRELVPHELR